MTTIEELSGVVKEARKHQGLSQEMLALAAGTGTRFIIELEKGKPTCQIGKVFQVLETLGIRVDFELGERG